MTTVDLYKKHKSGDISREKFLYEVRRDTRLPFITNLTSYNDAVQILKNKSIIKEEAYPEEDPYNQGLAANKAHKSHTENPYNKTAFPQQNAAWHEGWMDGETENQMKHDEEQFRRERGGIDEAGKDYNPEGAWQEGYDAFMAGHHQEENPYEGDTTEHKNWDIGYEKAQHDGPGMNEEENKVLGKDAQAIVDSIKNGKVDLEDLKAATEKAMKGNPDELALMMIGLRPIKEGKEVTMDTVNPYEFRKGLSWELGYATKPSPDWDDSSITNEDMEKASKKVLKNLSSNPIYYTELIANKGEKAKKEKEVKVEEDGMAKIKGVEKVSANVQTSLGKKEKGKLRPEGVKEMKGSKKAFSKIKLMKENEEPIVDKKEAFKNKLKEMLKLEISDTLKQQISQEKKKLGQLYQKAGQQMANPTAGGTGNDPFGM